MFSFLKIQHKTENILDPSEPGIDLDQFEREDWSTTPYGDGAGGCRKFKKIPLSLRIELLDNKTNPPKNSIFYSLWNNNNYMIIEIQHNIII